MNTTLCFINVIRILLKKIQIFLSLYQLTKRPLTRYLVILQSAKHAGVAVIRSQLIYYFDCARLKYAQRWHEACDAAAN